VLPILTDKPLQIVLVQINSSMMDLVPFVKIVPVNVLLVTMPPLVLPVNQE
jgi:hypothetical protein